MGASGMVRMVQRNDATMDGNLPSTESRKHWDHCCGIHGAMRERRGEKHAKVTARRRNDKLVIQEALENE